MDAEPATHAELLAQGRWLRRLASSLVTDGAEADDVAQEALLAALRSPPDAGRPLRPWLRRVVANVVRKRRRGEGRRAEREERRALEPLPAPDRLVEQMEIQHEVIAAVLALDEPHRSAVVLHYYRGLSAAEIARRTGATPEAVRQRLKRARDRLRAALDRRCDGRRSWLPALTAFARPRGVSPWMGAWTAKKVVLAGAVILAAAWGAYRLGSPDQRAPQRPNAVPELAARADREADGAIAVDAGGPDDARRLVAAPASRAPTGSLTLVARRPDGAPAPWAVAVVEARGAGEPWPWLRTAPVDAHGTVRLADVPTGDVRVGLLRLPPRHLVLAPGEDARVELVVPGGVDVLGRVVDARGAPVAGAEVWLSETTDVERVGRRHGAAQPIERGAVVATTDDRGRFLLSSVRVDQHLGARKAGHAPSVLVRPHGAPGDECELELVLPGAEGRLRGRVLDPAGRPVTGARVCAGDPRAGSDVVLADGRGTHGPSVRTTTTDADGEFALDALTPGPTPLEVSRSGLAVHRSAREAGSGPAEPIEIRMQPTPRLAGRVLDERGRAVARATVIELGPGASAAQARSGADGRYELAGLPVGPCRIAARAESGTSEVALALAAGEVRALDLTLTARPLFHGTVVDGRGRPLAGWEVAARPEGRHEEEESIAVTGEDGAFRLGVAADVLRVHVDAPGRWAEFPMLVRRALRSSASPVELRVVDARDTTGTLVGRVVDPEGLPVSAALVGIWHQREKIWRGARPDRDGRFEIARIPPGDITLDVNPDRFPWVGLGEPSIEAGATLDVGTVRLAPGGSLRGRLVGLDEAVAARAEVWIEGAGTLLGDGAALRREGRSFTTGPLAAGRYTVRVAGEALQSSFVECDVRAGSETEVTLALLSAEVRRVTLVVPEGVLPSYALAFEVLDGERPVWDGWTSVVAAGPIDLVVSAPPGRYALRVRERYEPGRVLHLGPIDVGGPQGREPLRVVLEAPAD